MSKYITENEKNITLFKTPQIEVGEPARDGFFIDYRKIGYGSHYDEAVHYHDFFEIELVCEGTAVHRLNRELINVSRGYAALLKKHDYHAYHFKDTESLALYSICFDEKHISSSLSERLIERCGTSDCFLSEDEYNKIISLTQILYDIFYNPGLDYSVSIKSCLNLILSTLLKNFPNENQKCDISRHMREALLYIEQHFSSQDLSQQEVANAIGISQNYLGRLFTSELNKSYTYYIRERRLTHSLRYLEQRVVSVDDIARLCGFGSGTYYISVFKKRYGTTPKKYIKSIR
jgi:AraC-like DNA-binding protein